MGGVVELDGRLGQPAGTWRRAGGRPCRRSTRRTYLTSRRLSAPASTTPRARSRTRRGRCRARCPRAARSSSTLTRRCWTQRAAVAAASFGPHPGTSARSSTVDAGAVTSSPLSRTAANPVRSRNRVPGSRVASCPGGSQATMTWGGSTVTSWRYCAACAPGPNPVNPAAGRRARPIHSNGPVWAWYRPRLSRLHRRVVTAQRRASSVSPASRALGVVSTPCCERTSASRSMASGCPRGARRPRRRPGRMSA